MLTLGAEYRDTWWGPTTGDSRRLKERSEEELVTVTQTDACSEDKNDHTWREFHFSGNDVKYDTFLSLDGLSRVGQRDGVLQMIRKHENLNGTTWPCR